MMKTLTIEQIDRAESLLDLMRQTQTHLWDLSLQLETVIGCDVDTTRDLQDATVESLLA